jgi:hypothetical protein
LTAAQALNPTRTGPGIISLLALFAIIFGTKLHGIFDIPIIVAFAYFIQAAIQGRFNLPKALVPYISLLIFLTTYAGIISLLWGVQEIFFFAKFLHALLLFVFLYFVWEHVSRKLTYKLFAKYYVLMVVAHSIIVISLIFSPELREVIYGITGYVPRGPEWSRSPGLTISFNATAILHICGLWFLVSRDDWGKLARLFFGIIVLASFVFLGRFVFIVGGGLIICLLVVSRPVRAIWFALSAVGVVGLAAIWVSNQNTTEDSMVGNLAANVSHFTVPFVGGEGSSESIGNYGSEVMASHIYFSDEWYVLLFGDSFSGHLGLMSVRGETDSDMGVVNSINANGILITIVIFISYFIFIWQSRRGDWMTVALVSLLCLALSFKETGIFDSHSIQLLFLLFFYQRFAADSRLPKVVQ